MLNHSPARISCAAVVAAWVGFACCPVVSGQQTMVRVQSVNGTLVEGAISAINTGLVSVNSKTGPVELTFDQINSVKFGNPAHPASSNIIVIQLVDGSKLNAASIALESRTLNIRLHCGVEMNVSTRDVQFIQFKNYATEPNLDRQWKDVLEDGSREGDAIIINRDDDLNVVEGIVGDMGAEKLNFSIGDRTARVSVEKIDAIFFYHATGREFEDPVCEMLLTDNSKIFLREINWDRPKFSAVMACGTKLVLQPAKLTGLNFTSGRDVWLSSLEPSTNDWQPLMTSSAILEKLRRLKLARVNQSFSGDPLSLRLNSENGSPFTAPIVQFENGFAIQGGGKLAFGVKRKFRKLTGWVGFDPSANPSGNVLFKIIVDGKVKVEQELVSREMNNPVELNVEITNADRIVFQVDYHDGRSIGDQLHLVNLKVSR